MEVHVIREAGHEEALFGISLSYNSDVNRMPTVARKLCSLDKGHNKFLESICVWLDVNAPRYWWSQFDTYRIGVTKQSESTMHTLTRQTLTQEHFEGEINPFFIQHLNDLITKRDLVAAKRHLPEAFLQRRIICTNYKALRGVVGQRATHKLPEWGLFIEAISSELIHPEYILFKD